tara:strand:+ start:77 stop:451 length:375 start_codon:yes stop_codon:yes gene_type:complete
MKINNLLSRQLPFVDVVNILSAVDYEDLGEYLGCDLYYKILPYVFEVCDEMNFEVYEMTMDSLFVRKFGDTYDVMVYVEEDAYLKGNYFSVEGIDYLAIGGEVDVSDYDISSMKSLKQELLSDV